jgi:hypothetical protein
MPCVCYSDIFNMRQSNIKILKWYHYNNQLHAKGAGIAQSLQRMGMGWGAKGLWWTKRHWGRFSPSTSVSPANHHSTNFSIIITTRGWHNRYVGGCSAEWTQLDSTSPTIPIIKRPRDRGLVPVGGDRFSLLRTSQTGTGSHLANHPMSSRGCFLRGKEAGTWSWPLTSTQCRC